MVSSTKSRSRPAAALPESPAPMLCTLTDRPFDHPDWIFEPKYDGLRVVARFDGRRVTLLSRNGKPQDLAFPEIVEGLGEALKRPAIVDGEVVCLDDHGRTSFRELQQRFHLLDAKEIAARRERHPAYLFLFDLLNLDGRDVTGLPLVERKELLRSAVRWSDRVRWTEAHEGGGVEALRAACDGGDEGVIGKRLDSRYVGGRSDAWVKVKCVGRQEFVIGGWTDPRRSRVGLGALLVGYYDDGGKRLIYAGKVGTGYTRETLLDLRERLETLGKPDSPFDEGEPPAGEQVHWVRPRLVAEIGFAEWTQNGLLRQPRFEGLRADKSPRDCRRERPESSARRRAEASRSSRNGGGPSMALDEYEKKRDFRKTPEPSGRAGEIHQRPIFVVQEHHASHLHYDFRLEADGVLKSWAVPKRPTLDPSQKRLAVQVEDHPIAYADFRGDIPQGEYGGGHVEIWDRGTYENLLADKSEPRTMAEGIEAGRLEFSLQGEKLRGKFALIRMKGRAHAKGKPQWLLIKMRDEFARGEGGAEKEATAKAKAKASPPKRAARAPKGEVELTNADRVVYPEAGLTKGDVFDYYRRIADRLLPFLKDRPVTLERLPEGLTGAKAPHFWQKDTPEYYPAWIARAEETTEAGKPVHYALVNDLPTLLYLVNQGTMTFHVWSSRLRDLDRPDFVLFDLDPGQGTFADVVRVAKEVRAALEGEGIESFVKTSGKRGLHVLTPWTEPGGFDQARARALGLAERVVESSPDLATVEIRKAKRGKRVYIDVLQNARGHHAVPPYVLRAVPEATISTPLDWRELTADLDPKAFTPKTIFRRLARKKSDPWEGLVRTFAGKRRSATSRR